MTLARLISIDTRSGLLVGLGAAILFAPFALGLSVAAMVVGVTIGALALGLGLAGTASSGRGTIPVNAHMAYDAGLAFGMLLTAAAFGLTGEGAAGGLFGVAGLAQLVLSTTTRYTRTAA